MFFYCFHKASVDTLRRKSLIFSQTLKPQDRFGVFDKKKILIFRKYTKPSESTIKPTENCFEWHVQMQ